MATGGGIVLGLLGAGLVYVLVKSKEQSDQFDSVQEGEEGAQPPALPPRPPQAPRARVPAARPAPPPYQAPRPRPWQGPPPPAYPPPRQSPVFDLGGWVHATQADVNRDGATDWYIQLLNSPHPAGYSEQRTIGGRQWKLTIVSAATHPQLTHRSRDVIGWVQPGQGRPAPPLQRAPHPFYPPPTHAPPPVSYNQPPPVSYPPAAFAPQWPSYAAPPSPQPSSSPASPPPAVPPWPHPHHHHHPAPPPPVAPEAAAPSTGECKSWHPATDADVHKDGVASVYHAMLSLPESSPPRIESHNGRTWKFQVVTPSSDPSFSFAPGKTKAVRGWICADEAPPRDTSDPGY